MKKLLSFFLLFCGIYGKMRLKRSFPAVNEHGMQLANEFQVVHPENIVLHSTLRDSSDFKILDISPLSISNDEIVTVSFSAKAPTGKEWIGAYSPPDVDITLTVPGMFLIY